MLPFFFTDTTTTEIYTLSLHDALPILERLIELHFHLAGHRQLDDLPPALVRDLAREGHSAALHLFDRLLDVVAVKRDVDRKSTRLNSSHGYISYAVFCLKKKKNQQSEC